MGILWSEEEEKELLRCVRKYGRDWNKIAKVGKFSHGRTAAGLARKWSRVREERVRYRIGTYGLHKVVPRSHSPELSPKLRTWAKRYGLDMSMKLKLGEVIEILIRSSEPSLEILEKLRQTFITHMSRNDTQLEIELCTKQMEWNTDEESELLRCVKEYGNDWEKIGAVGQFSQQKTTDSLRHKYHRMFRNGNPDTYLRGRKPAEVTPPWSAEDTEELLRCVRKYGKNFVIIGEKGHFSTIRTANAIKKKHQRVLARGIPVVRSASVRLTNRKIDPKYKVDMSMKLKLSDIVRIILRSSNKSSEMREKLRHSFISYLGIRTDEELSEK